MSFARKKFIAWRENPLVLAATISLAVHLTLFSGWKLNQRFHWWKHDKMPMWLQKLSRDLPKKISQKTTTQSSQVPLIFADVDPQLSTKEPPKEAKFYGAANAKAAAKTEADAELPDLQGKQDKVIKTTENSKSKAQPLQPSPPKPEAEADEESKPREKQVVGDLAVAKPQDQNKKVNGEAGKEARPRKLSDVKSGLRGEKMKQPGGAKRLTLDSPSFDVKVTSFGDYDREFISAVQQRWYELLEGRNTVPGKIVVEFTLNYDGRITDLKLVENTTQNVMLELICKGAIADPSPYRKWPTAMRQEMRSDAREVRFTFYYE